MKKIDIIKIKILSIEILRFLKDKYKYRELETIFNLPSPVLNRYIQGKVLPSEERAKEIIKIFEEKLLKDFVMKNIIITGKEKIFDHSELLSNIKLLEIIAKIVFNKFVDLRPTKILTKETSGISFATLVAREFSIPLLVARERKEIGIEEFIEGKRVFPEGTYRYIYLPKKLIDKEDRILIVDDSTRTGGTFLALSEICSKANAQLVGAFFIIAIRETLRNLKKKFKIPFYTLVTL